MDCTCQDCAYRLLEKKRLNRYKGSWEGHAVANQGANHPTGCTCAGWVLLGLLEILSET